MASAAQHKHYLSGIDWFVKALDQRTRAKTGSGSTSQIAIALAGKINPADVRDRLNRFLEAHPILAGRCRRNPLNLAPYWQLPRTMQSAVIALDVRPDLSDFGVLPPPALAGEVNQPLAGLPRIAFTLAPGENRSWLAMRFDHQLLDAGGAERLLQHIGGNTGTYLSAGDRRVHLDQWMEKFRSGQKVNRTLLALRDTQPPAALPCPERGRPVPSLFIFRSFDPQQCQTITANAEQCVGYLMLLPFLLGVSVNAFHALCRRQGIDGRHYVIPVTMNARRPADIDTVFFNHLSFNFYRFEAAAAANRPLLWQQAATQMYRQAADRIAYHVQQAGYPLRILPAAWLGRLMGLPLAGTLGSFSFALVGGKEYDADTFMDTPIENIYHMPRVPSPPGIGIYFNRYRDRLNMVFSYLEGMLTREDAEQMVDAIAEHLLEQNGRPAPTPDQTIL